MRKRERERERERESERERVCVSNIIILTIPFLMSKL